MAKLSGPMEFLKLLDGRSVEFTVLRYEEGEGEANLPRPRPDGKVPVLRVHVKPTDRPMFPPYWDITAGRAKLSLRPMNNPNVHLGKRVKLTKHGVEPASAFTVDIVKP